MNAASLQSVFALSALCCAALVLAGCGSSLPADVQGTVTLDGQPLTDGNVTFYATTAAATATGRIQTDGSYRIRTGHAEGLQTGMYKVAVKSVRGAPGPSMTRAQVESLFITPKRYGDPQTSGLEFEVQRGSNIYDIVLLK